MSLPAWGGWIEMAAGYVRPVPPTSLPAWGGWIEIGMMWRMTVKIMSLPAWGGGIEIHLLHGQGRPFDVPPRMGRVD